MIVTNQLQIINNKIKVNQAQYDLDRLAAKISAYSSGDFRKYENLPAEDLRYKPSVVEQGNFDYSPLGNILIRDWIKMIKIKGFLRGSKILKAKTKSCCKHLVHLIEFKRLENIKGKTKSCCMHLVQLIELVRLLKMILIMTLSTLFTGFTETLKNLREWY